MVTCSKCGLNALKKDESVTFHRFPMNPIVKAQWLAFVQKINWEPKKNSTMCSQHFEDDCFNNTSLFKRLLKPGSVPTIDLSHSKDDCSEGTGQQSNTTTDKTKIVVPNLNKDKPIPKVLRERARKTEASKKISLIVEENQSLLAVKGKALALDSDEPNTDDSDDGTASVSSDHSMDFNENIYTTDDPSVVFHALEDVYYESDSDVSCHEESDVVLKSKFNQVKIRKSHLKEKLENKKNRFVTIGEKKMDTDREKQVLLRCNEKLREKLKERGKTVRWLQKLSWKYKARNRDLLYRLDEMKDLLEHHGIVYKKKGMDVKL